jgi:hypothetical protein
MRLKVIGEHTKKNLVLLTVYCGDGCVVDVGLRVFRSLVHLSRRVKEEGEGEVPSQFEPDGSLEMD